MFRRVIAALLIIVASLLAPFAVGALWAERTLTDTDIFVETLAPLADDPAVQQTVASEVSAAIIDRLDAQDRVERALAQINGPLAGIRPDSAIAQGIASGINGAIESGVTSYTQSDRFGDAWLAIATELQQQFLNLINRDTANAAVTLEDGKIVLDTKVALDKVQAQLAARGVPFAGTLNIPGREIVLADTPNLQTAATAISIFLPMANWMWVIVVIMFLVGILLWRPRARGVLWAGLGLTLGGILMYAGLNLGMDQLVSAAPSDYSFVLESVSTTLLRFLVNALLVMACLGIAMMVAAWLAGATRSGRRVRQAVADSAHRWASPLADGPVGRFTAANQVLVPVLRGLVVVVAVGYLILADRLSPVEVLWTAVLTGVALLLVEIVAGAGRGFEESRVALIAPALFDPVTVAATDQPPPPAGTPPGTGSAPEI